MYEGDFPKTFLPVAKSAGAGAGLECGAGGGMVVTGLDNPSGTMTAKWRWTNAPSDGSCTPTFVTATSGSSLNKPAVLGTYTPPNGLSAVVVELTTSWSGHVVGRSFLEFLDGYYKTSLLGAFAGPFTMRSYAVAVPRPGVLPLLKTGNRP